MGWGFIGFVPVCSLSPACTMRAVHRSKRPPARCAPGGVAGSTAPTRACGVSSETTSRASATARRGTVSPAGAGRRRGGGSRLGLCRLRDRPGPLEQCFTWSAREARPEPLAVHLGAVPNQGRVMLTHPNPPPPRYVRRLASPAKRGGAVGRSNDCVVVSRAEPPAAGTSAAGAGCKVAHCTHLHTHRPTSANSEIRTAASGHVIAVCPP